MTKHKFAFIDIETTGLNLIKHEIIEIGCVVTTAGLKVVEEFSLKIKPERIEDADPVALKVNNYNATKWETAGGLKEAMEILAEKTTGCIMVGQNVAFDSGFLEYAFASTGTTNQMHYHRLDTISIASAILRGKKDVTRFSLRELCKYFGVEQKDAHTGLGDARSTFLLYKKMMQS